MNDQKKILVFQEKALHALTRPGFILILIVMALWLGIVILSSYSGFINSSLMFMMMSLVGFVAVMVHEMNARRKWENDLIQTVEQLQSSQQKIQHDHNERVKQIEQLKMALGHVIDQLQKAPSQIITNKNNTAQRIAAHLSTSSAHSQYSQQIETAIRRERMDIQLLPVVRLPQQKIAFFEIQPALMVHTKMTLSASEYKEVARANQLLLTVENLFLMKALQEIRSREKTENTAVDYFINLDSETLSQSTFVADLADFLTANRYMASRLIFEMSQNDYITIKANLREVFASLSQLGCRFAMGDIFDFSLDSKMLKKNMISFVKIESDHLRRYLNRPDGKMTVLSLKKELDINGIDLVACQINSEEELLGLEALNVDFGQGQLFYSKSKPNERAA